MKSPDFACFWAASILVSGVLLGGCASGSGSPAAAPASAPTSSQQSTVPNISLTVTPAQIGVPISGNLSFSATVSGTADQSVTWSITEGSAGGTISSTGAYTAPASTGLFHIVATSKQDPAKSAVATVNVVSIGLAETGSMSTARFGHTATLLNSGNVLIAGGNSGQSIAGDAEVFDPATGSFQPAGKLKRFYDTATLLPNGDVLFAGGETENPGSTPPPTSQTADILKASSGTFGTTGNLVTARESHSAVLLNDGRVLITGGGALQGNNWIDIARSEFYDPATGTFSAGADLNFGRSVHTSTLLPNGTVLIAGGLAYEMPTLDAQVFDPSTNSFRSTGRMNKYRTYHTATLLPNGKVLIAGGETATAELYDPVTGVFTLTGSMSFDRGFHTATLLPNGMVLIAGGYLGSAGWRTTNTTEIYNPATGTFSPGPSMKRSRYRHTATLLKDGRVLIAGGAESSDGKTSTALSDAEITY